MVMYYFNVTIPVTRVITFFSSRHRFIDLISSSKQLSGCVKQQNKVMTFRNKPVDGA